MTHPARPRARSLPAPPAIVFGLLAVLILGGLGCPEAESADNRPIAPPPVADTVFRAVTLDARERPDASTLPRLAALGVTHVTLTTFGFQPRPDVPAIRMNPDARWYSESDDGIRTLAREAQSLGMEVIIKPHIWVGGYDTAGQTRHRIGFAAEQAWQQWEAAYRTFILHYASLSAELGAPLFVVGTELAHVAKTRPAFWRALIADVRQVYGGALTYAANWYDEYEHIPFWDALDYIGVQAYFELTDAEAPAVDTLADAWTPHLAALEQLARSVDRPILFTEIGYRSVPYAAAEPWRWPQRDEQAPADPALQARLYEAFFDRVWPEPWFAGAILWKWYPYGRAQSDRTRRDFTPQFKPAETVIARGFGGTAPTEGP